MHAWNTAAMKKIIYVDIGYFRYTSDMDMAFLTEIPTALFSSDSTEPRCERTS